MQTFCLRYKKFEYEHLKIEEENVHIMHQFSVLPNSVKSKKTLPNSKPNV